jgi:hypothetical protein
MARLVIRQKGVAAIAGMNEVLSNIEKIIAATDAGELMTDLFVEASKHIWTQTKRNIASLPVSADLKEVLDAETIINRAKRGNPYVLVGMSQQAGIKKLGGRHLKMTRGGKRFIPSPYWFEFGTADRATGKSNSKGQKFFSFGRRTGRIQATPFFRPAVSAAKPLVKQALAKGFPQILEKAIAK